MINFYLFIVLAILWFLDEILTIIDIKKFGINREANPIAKYFLEHGKFAFTLFKIVTLALFYLMFNFVERYDEGMASIILIIPIIAYFVVDLRNFEIMIGKLK